MQRQNPSENFKNLNKHEAATGDNICKHSFIIYIIVGILAAVIAGGGVYAYGRVKTKMIERDLLTQIQLLQNQVEQLNLDSVGKASLQPQEDDAKILGELFFCKSRQ